MLKLKVESQKAKQEKSKGKTREVTPLIIAIDGPSGAGKGTVARAIAKELGYRHVDSGAMYRAIGWQALRDAVLLEDSEAVARLTERSHVEVSSSRVAINGVD